MTGRIHSLETMGTVDGIWLCSTLQQIDETTTR